MNLHRCSACTLMRCSGPGMTCDECVANGAVAPTTHIMFHAYFGGGSVPDLRQFPREEVAKAMKNWIMNMLPWEKSARGPTFWADVYTELGRIANGNMP
jgi:hypothetical protein